MGMQEVYFTGVALGKDRARELACKQYEAWTMDGDRDVRMLETVENHVFAAEYAQVIKVTHWVDEGEGILDDEGNEWARF